MLIITVELPEVVIKEVAVIRKNLEEEVGVIRQLVVVVIQRRVVVVEVVRNGVIIAHTTEGVVGVRVRLQPVVEHLQREVEVLVLKEIVVQERMQLLVPQIAVEVVEDVPGILILVSIVVGQEFVFFVG